jgi:hypothetical protein
MILASAAEKALLLDMMSIAGALMLRVFRYAEGHRQAPDQNGGRMAHFPLSLSI